MIEQSQSILRLLRDRIGFIVRPVALPATAIIHPDDAVAFKGWHRVVEIARCSRQACQTQDWLALAFVGIEKPRAAGRCNVGHGSGLCEIGDCRQIAQYMGWRARQAVHRQTHPVYPNRYEPIMCRIGCIPTIGRNKQDFI